MKKRKEVEKRREEKVCCNGVADKGEERPSMEAWLGREHYNLSIFASPPCSHHPLHSRALALPLPLHQLQQEDGEDRNRHEVVPLHPSRAIDLPGPVDLREGSQFVVSGLGWSLSYKPSDLRAVRPIETSECKNTEACVSLIKNKNACRTALFAH